MEIRELTEDDVRKFYDCMKALDNETVFMMLEPDERVWNEKQILGVLRNKDNLLLGVIDQGNVIGFLSAERGRYRRTRHSAYIVTGIRNSYCNQGIGTELFHRLDDWAIHKHISRLELTVECSNKGAIHLYEKSGFIIEGTKKNTMYVHGQYVDEYSMAKLF